MSDNPFASPADPSNVVPNNPQLSNIPTPAPGALTVICILCLILGLLGFVGSCFGVVMLAFQSMIMDSLLGNVPSSPDMEFQKMNLAAQDGFRIPNMILMGINLIVGSILFIGSIGCLQRKESFRNILRTGLLAAIVYSVLKMILAVVAGLSTPGAMRAELEKLPKDADFATIEGLVTMTAMFTWIGIAFAVVLGLALAGFYVWSRSYLNRPEIVKHFS